MTTNEFKIWIDNDACPKRIRELIFKAAKRLDISVNIVANSYMHPPAGVKANVITVSGAFDAADNYIAENVEEGDLVITADVPLADRVVQQKATALSPRGKLFDSHSIKEHLALRNLRNELLGAGTVQGGPPEFDTRDVNKFAQAFDKIVTARTKSR